LGRGEKDLPQAKAAKADRAGAREPIDLHAHQMYVCLMDRQGKKLVHTSLRSKPQRRAKTAAP